MEEKRFRLFTNPTGRRIFEERPDLTMETKKRNPIIRNRIFLEKTSATSDEDLEGVQEGINRIIAEINSRVIVMRHPDTGFIKRLDTYSVKAYDRRRKNAGTQSVEMGKLVTLLNGDISQRKDPHQDMVVLDRQLNVRGSLVYGASEYPHAALSIKSLGQQINGDPVLRKKILSCVGAHEFLHFFGLTQRNFNRDGNHCAGENGPCIMQVNKNPNEKTFEIIEREHLLCSDCRDEVAFRKEKLAEDGIVL